MRFNNSLLLTTLLCALIIGAFSFSAQGKLSKSPTTFESELLEYLINARNPDLDFILKQITGSDDELFSKAKEVFSTYLAETQETSVATNGNFGCKECLQIAPVFDLILSTPKLRNSVYAVAATLCVLSGFVSSRVCVLGVEEWGPIVVYLGDNYYLTTDEVCGFLFSDDCVEPVIQPANWTLNFPSTPKPDYVAPTSPPEGTPIAKVVHLSDIHLDLSYLEGSNSRCEDPLCCRAIDGEPISYFYAAGKYGTTAYCDTPLITLENLLQKLSAEASDFEWVIVTGDLPPHDVYNQTKEDNIKVLRVVNGLLKKYLPNTKVLQAVGNHASCPVDQYVPPYMDQNKTANPMSWLYDVLAEEWSFWLPNSTLDTIRKGGYWSWEFTPGLKMISLNLVYGQVDDWYTRANISDFNGMLQWLIDELQDAEDRNVKAWFISHHPHLSLPYYKNQFDKIVQRYINVISGWFNGHVHTDQFQVLYDDSISSATGEPVPVLNSFISPSVTTYHASNMAYRVYYVDAVRDNATFFPTNHQTYFLNVTNTKLTGEVNWELEYDMKKAYDMEGLLPSDVDKVIKRMATDTKLATQYLYLLNKSASEVSCDENCAKNTAAGLQRVLDPNTNRTSQKVH